MASQFGTLFMPGADGQQRLGKTGSGPQPPRNPVQEAVQVLSLRLPKVFGARPVVPQAISMGTPGIGGMGNPAAKGNVSAQALAGLAGLPPSMAAPSSPAPFIPPPMSAPQSAPTPPPMPAPSYPEPDNRGDVEPPPVFTKPPDPDRPRPTAPIPIPTDSTPRTAPPAGMPPPPPSVSYGDPPPTFGSQPVPPPEPPLVGFPQPPEPGPAYDPGPDMPAPDIQGIYDMADQLFRKYGNYGGYY